MEVRFRVDAEEWASWLYRPVTRRLAAAERDAPTCSDPKPGKRDYLGWSGDVEQLADSLGIEHFGALAYSCGGPYALAAASMLGERLSAVAVVSSVAPSEMARYRRGTAPTDKIMTLLAPRAPRLAHALMARPARRRMEAGAFREAAARRLPRRRRP